MVEHEDLKSKLSYKDGELRLGNVRVVMVPALWLGTLGAALAELLGEHGAEAIFRETAYRAGYACGVHVYEDLSESGISDKEGMIKGFVSSLSSAGWGKFSLVKAKLDEPIKVVIRGENTYISEIGITRAGEPRCHPLKWFAAGVLKALLLEFGFTGEIDAEETACIAKGDPYCEIVLKEL